MKTPREVLLNRHRSALPKLDAVREQVLADMAQSKDHSLKPSTTQAQPGPINLRSILRSWRWHLAGLSTVWLAILLLQIESPVRPAPPVASHRPKTHELLMALREHRRQLAELIGASASPSSSEDPLAFPQRRSQLQPSILEC